VQGCQGMHHLQTQRQLQRCGRHCQGRKSDRLQAALVRMYSMPRRFRPGFERFRSTPKNEARPSAMVWAFTWRRMCLCFYSRSKNSTAMSRILPIVLVSTVSSAYSRTRLSFPAQVTAPNTKLTLAKGKAPPGFIIKRSNSSPP
jgi:hypothetical protein